MNWEVLGTIAEIVGAIGVVASLLFLAFETRNNTKTMRSSLSNDALNATANLNDIIFADPELQRAVSKATNPDLEITDFNDEEWNSVIYLGRALFMRLEGAYILYKQGLVENEVWECRRAIGAGLLQIPIWQRYWIEEQANNVFTRGFVTELDSVMNYKFHTPTRSSDN